MTEDGRPTLTYFDLRGRAEPIRLLFTDQGIPFMDRRIRSPGSWQALRRSLPLRVLPHYGDPRLSLTQSSAILRYLGASVGMTPSDPVGQAPYDEAFDAIAEVQEALWQFAWQPEYYNQPEVFVNGALNRYLANLERLYMRDESEFWVGGRISHVDYLAYAFADELRAFFPQALVEFEMLAAFHAHMAARPRISAYKGSRKQPVVFGMGLHGPKVDPASVISPGDVFENPWREPIPLEPQGMALN